MKLVVMGTGPLGGLVPKLRLGTHVAEALLPGGSVGAEIALEAELRYLRSQAELGNEM